MTQQEYINSMVLMAQEIVKLRKELEDAHEMRKIYFDKYYDLQEKYDELTNSNNEEK